MQSRQLLNGVDAAVTITGTAFGLAEIETVLGIVILTINLIWILIRGIIMVSDKLRKKDIKGAVEEGDKTIQDINDLTNKEENKDGRQ